MGWETKIFKIAANYLKRGTDIVYSWIDLLYHQSDCSSRRQQYRYSYKKKEGVNY